MSILDEMESIRSLAATYPREAAHSYFTNVRGVNDYETVPIADRLRCISAFFDSPRHLRHGLSLVQVAQILDECGYLLQANGQLSEAWWYKSEAVHRFTRAEAWADAARAGARLSELQLYTGHVLQAIRCAETALVRAQQSGDAALCAFAGAKLGNAFSMRGSRGLAREAFEAAVQHGLLDFSAYLYGEFLATEGNLEAARVCLEAALNTKRPHVHGLVHVLLSSLSDGTEALRSIDFGVQRVRDSEVVDELPRALLHRAHWLRDHAQCERALADANEALALSESSGLALFQLLSCVELAKLLADGNPRAAETNRLRARGLAHHAKYGRSLGL